MNNIISVSFCRDELPGGDWNENVMSEVGFEKDGIDVYVAVLSITEFHNIFVTDKPVYEDLLAVLKEEDTRKAAKLYEKIKKEALEYYEIEDGDEEEMLQSEYSEELLKGLEANKDFAENSELYEDEWLIEQNRTEIARETSYLYKTIRLDGQEPFRFRVAIDVGDFYYRGITLPDFEKLCAYCLYQTKKSLTEENISDPAQAIDLFSGLLELNLFDGVYVADNEELFEEDKERWN